jgi:exonuclease III
VGTSLGDMKQKANCNNFKVLQWNTGGLNQVKKTELYKILEEGEIDEFCILEANVTEENTEYFHFKNYRLNFLTKSKQTASSILIGTCKPLKHAFNIIKRMNDDDKIEIIKFNV